VQAIQVPPTVQAMLAARIDRLSPEDKRLLQVASAVGKDVPFALLQEIAELPDEALRRGLDHLQAAEFLDETGLFPDLEYAFKHALTHEVTYGGLLNPLGEVRRALERLREAEVLAERLNDDRRRGRVCAVMTNVHSLLGELDEALMTGTRALEIAGRLGDLRLRIPATSYLEQARGHLTTATAMYREMDMQFWLERAESESRELGA
jgi:predicted ATPase